MSKVLYGMSITEGISVFEDTDESAEAVKVEDTCGFIPTITIPLDGQSWDDEDWDIWVDMNPHQMWFLYSVCKIKELRKVIEDEVYFRIDDPCFGSEWDLPYLKRLNTAPYSEVDNG